MMLISVIGGAVRRRIALGALLAASLGSWSSADAASEHDTREHELGVGLGAAFIQVRDDLVVPLRFRGFGLALTAAYATRGTANEAYARTRFALDGFWDRYGYAGIAMSAWLEGAYRFTVHEDSRARWTLGPWLGNHTLSAEYQGWDDEHSYWLAYFGLGPSVGVTVPAGRRHVELEAIVPLVEVISRPPRYRLYKADPQDELGFHLSRSFDAPRFGSFNELLALRLRGAYRGEGRGVRIDPWCEVSFETDPHPARVIDLELWLGAEVRFGL